MTFHSNPSWDPPQHRKVTMKWPARPWPSAVPVLRGDIARPVTDHNERTGARPLNRGTLYDPGQHALLSGRAPVRSSWPVAGRTM